MTIDIDNAVRTSLLAFAMKAFAQANQGKHLVAQPYLRYLASNLERVANDEVKRLVVALPPRHLKTFLASECLAAWILAHDPATKIMIVSYGQELASKIAYGIREILKAEWFRRAFKTKVAKFKLNDIITTAGGGVRSVSLEGGVTGLGADVIIVDDPVQIKDCDNAKQLERVNDLFDGEIRTRLNDPKRGRIVIVAHRLSEDDLPGHVLKEKGGWRKVSLPLIAPRARTYKTNDGFVWDRRQGELLRPDAFTRRDINRLRAMKRPNFSTLQQQDPGAQDRLRIKAKHFGRFMRKALPTDLPVVLSIDPGQKGGPTNSFSVIQAWGFRAGGYMLLDQWRDQAPYRDFRHEVLVFIRRYRPRAILIEATGQGPALSSDIRPAQGVVVVQITPTEDKVTRLQKHRRVIRSGVVHLPDNAMWVDDFLAELTLFPYAAFDDQADAMSQFLDWASQNPTPPPPPTRAHMAVAGSRGIAYQRSANLAPASECRGCVVAHRPHIRRY